MTRLRSDCALQWRNRLHAASDKLPERGAGGALAQVRLDVGVGVFDGVEVGRVGRRIAQLGCGGLDRLAHARNLVRTHIVHEDDVAFFRVGTSTCST
jgi:hypothetical protein